MFNLKLKIMKKLTILAALIIMSASVFAQSIEFGAKAGLNMATITKFDPVFAGDKNLTMRPGMYVGAFGEYIINDFFGIQGELLYSMMGAKQKQYPDMENINGGSVVSNLVNVTYKTDYIVLPILAKLYVAEKLSLDLGPQFGFMISAKMKETGAITRNESYYVGNKSDVSFCMGLSYKLSSKFDISARYNLGLTNLGLYDNYDSKNSVIQFGVGYRF